MGGEKRHFESERSGRRLLHLASRARADKEAVRTKRMFMSHAVGVRLAQ